MACTKYVWGIRLYRCWFEFLWVSFVQRMLKNNSFVKILILEHGDYFLPQHFQNLPLPFPHILGRVSETLLWSITPTMHNGEYIKWQHGQVPYLGGKSIMWSGWCPEPSNDEMPGRPNEIKACSCLTVPMVSIHGNARKPRQHDQCDGCEEWYHMACVGLKTPPPDTDSWLCSTACIV